MIIPILGACAYTLLVTSSITPIRPGDHVSRIRYGYARDTPGIHIHRVWTYWAAMGLETQVWIRICCRIGEQREKRASSRSAAVVGGGRREDGGAGHRSRAELATRRGRPPGRESQRGAPAAAAPNRGRRREQGRPAPPLHHEPRLRPAPLQPWPPREGAGRREGDPARRGRRAAAPPPSTRSGGRLPPSSPVPAREAGGAPPPAWGE